MLATVAVASAVTFGWAGWEVLRQESAAEEQRERERLENRADRVVQAIERVLGEVDEQLDARIAAPRAGPPATAEALVVVFDERSIQPVSPSVLVFHPVLSAQPKATESLFEAAGIEEFQRHSRDRAQLSVTRTTTDTGLPFSIQATGRDALGESGFMSRGRLVVAALTVMLAFLLAASYFIGRAVKQEMLLARLQADFVSAVSHEFRTPLASMRQLSELLAAGRVPVEARRQHYYESLAGESRRLQRLVENLLEFGKLESGPRPYQIEPVDPHALMESAVADFLSQLGRSDCRIEVSSGKVEAPVLADRHAMTLVLHNLLDNAVKYSGGRSVRLSWAHSGIGRSVPASVPERRPMTTLRQPTPTANPIRNGPEMMNFRPVL